MKHNFVTNKTTTFNHQFDSRIPSLTGKGSAKKSYTILEWDNVPATQKKLDMGAVVSTLAGNITYQAKRKRGRRKGRMRT